MAKEFEGVRCIIAFVRGQTFYNCSNRRFDKIEAVPSAHQL